MPPPRSPRSPHAAAAPRPPASAAPRAATDTARALTGSGDAAPSPQLRLVEPAAPLEAPPALGALARLAELRPDLPGLSHDAHRAVVSPL
ncbi:hypothetical protein [Streptomyces griseiscabiei]|uniref:Uncharacterized protein n=1 Tax=Streptomyces griseiscabiei TaxID=2993540 RepID=A0ABU4LIK4_9ACTN|nr:hypothetical protein [Streptomyces griseiscabiei]MDX2915635.1 hypothetical protein [Streptomyces griseiscabiei]